MSEWYDSQKKPRGTFGKLLKEYLDKTHLLRTLTSDETIRLTNLEVFAARVKRGENVQSD
jgi:hypothetical protein